MRTVHLAALALLIGCSDSGRDTSTTGDSPAVDGGALISFDVKPTPVSQPIADQKIATSDTRPALDSKSPAACPCGAGYLCMMNACHALCTPAGACNVDSNCAANEACVEAYQKEAFVGHICYPAPAAKDQSCDTAFCQNHLICLSTNGGPYLCQPCP
jgi:hypothetical protein